MSHLKTKSLIRCFKYSLLYNIKNKIQTGRQSLQLQLQQDKTVSIYNVMIFLKFFSDLKVLKTTYTCTHASTHTHTHTHTLKKKDRTWNISSELTTGGYIYVNFRNFFFLFGGGNQLPLRKQTARD